MAKLPPTERIPASVARYAFSWFWNVARLLDASGVLVANLLSANSSGVCLDVAKLMVEKAMPPETTSGTPERVVLLVSQVTTFWIEATVSDTSAGRAVLPMTKQAPACLSSKRGAMCVLEPRSPPRYERRGSQRTSK